jgi:putative peptidoglycan lipid II flippase
MGAPIAAPVEVGADGGADTGFVRSAITISAWNAVSRVTGLGRVLAVGAALGTTFVGNTYQTSNLVSNLLFELLAAGLLSAPLVPAFVALIDSDRRDEADRLAGALLGLALVVLAVVVVVGAVLGPVIMRGLTSMVNNPEVRQLEVELGAFFLWFFLPQVLLYAVLGVSTALLNADRHFASGAMAPIANNVVVTATMVAFVLLREGEPGLALPLQLKLLLALGTTAGVLGMASIPFIAVRRCGFSMRPRWEPRHPQLATVARVGAWGGVLLAAVQVLIGVTLVLANQVRGGVIAYQMAFTFFLLPIALAAHPVFTALYPRLAAQAQAGRWPGFAADVTEGVRRVVFVVLPASAVLAVVGTPALRVLRMGELDGAGVRLVGRVLAAYALGLAGYGCFLLLARAWTAAGNPRLPALVAIGVTVVGSVLMVAGSAATEGSDRVVILGLAHSAAMTLGAVALFVTLRRHCGVALPIGRTLVRSAATAVVAGVVSAMVVDVVDSGGRGGAAAALGAGVATAAVVVLVGQWMLGAPELRDVMRDMRGTA